MAKSFEEILMIKGGSKIVNDLAGVKEGEQVLIVTDLILSRATLVLDGQTVLKDGQVVI